MKNAPASNSPHPLSEAGFQRPLLIGEVLFDCFPNGRSVIGGAPFNVAWNLSGFGFNPLFISAVGDDELGRRVLQTMDDWKMDTDGLEVLPGKPTGRVEVQNAETEPVYEFQTDCAWDHLRLPGASFSPDQCGLVYHGSLAARSAVSRESILKLRSDPALPVFVDLNLRPPFYEGSQLRALVTDADWLKLNAAELRILSQIVNVSGGDLERQALQLCEELSLRNVLVTDGERGAHWISAGGEHHHAPAHSVDNFVDSVGAGDAFSAVTLAGIMQGWRPHSILQRSVAFAARVCELQGATTQTPSFYQDELKQWQ